MILEQMSKELSLPIKHIRRMVITASYHYKRYTIPKRAGGVRTIDHPSRSLKALQRWLLTNVIDNWPVHPAAKAYKKNVSIFDNASAHVKSKYLLRMDMKDFFPSITTSDMEAYMAKRSHLFEGWSSEDVSGFCGLVFRNGKLTIGAPTSPAISNVLCFDLDATLHTMSIGHGVEYTRYADDLFFSSKKKDVLSTIEKEVKGAVSSLTIPGSLKINDAKTRHSSKKGARRVTGIVLGSDGKPHVSRATKRYVRSLINKVDGLPPASKTKLAGLIAFIAGFEPAFLNSMVLKYGPDQVEKARLGK